MAQAQNENPVETGYDKNDCIYELLFTLTTSKSRGLIAKNAVETAFSAVELLQFTALPAGAELRGGLLLRVALVERELHP